MFKTNTITIHVENSMKCKSKVKLPKAIFVLFLTSQFLFGIDFGFTSTFKKKYRFIVKRFTFFLSIANIVLLTSALYLNDIFFWFNVFEYTLYFLLLNLTKYSAYHFISDISKIYELSQNDKKWISIVGIYYNGADLFMKAIFIVFLYKVGITSASYSSIAFLIVYYIPCIGMDTISIVQIVLMYYLNCCVRHLKALLIANDVNFKYVEKYFMNIANCYDKIKPLYGQIVSCIFVLSITFTLLCK